MDFTTLMQTGWRDHESATARVADDLTEHAGVVSDAGQAAQYAQLATHAVGEHLGDWPRAVGLVERVVAGRPDDAALSPALGSLAVARHFAGDLPGALAAESRAAALVEDPIGALVRTRMFLASAYLSAKQAEACAAVYRGAMALATKLPEGSGAARAIGVTSNNLAGALVEKEGRTEDETALMLEAAHAARTWWMRSGGTWVNEERADYLLSITHAAAGRPDEALTFADRALATIAANGEEKVDQAFLLLARADAHRLKRDAQAAAADLAKADALAAAFTDDGLKTWYASTSAKLR